MNKKKLVSVLAGVMAAVMLLSLLGGLIVSIIPAQAQKSSSEIEDEIEELEEEKAQIDEQIAQLESQLDANMDEMEAIVAQKNIIDQEVFLLYEQMENINAQLTAYGQLVADKQEELDAAKENLTYLNAKHRDRILAMEKNGSVSYWSVLFQASSFLDLLDRVRMVTQIAEADRRCLDYGDADFQQVRAVVFYNCIISLLQNICVHCVVAVDEKQIFTFCCMQYSSACSGRTTVWACNNFYAFIFFCVAV